MVLNAAVQMLREADELKQKILKFKSGTSMLQERSLWVNQQQLQKVYQKVLVLDLDYALEKKVEQDLWNVGFKQQIEALQAISKDRKNPLRNEGQTMLSWVLQAAAGFYLCLLHQICTTFKLDLPFRRRASLLGWVEGWGAGAGAAPPPPAAARYICQHCLVHLGDLARYRHQLRVAHTFYRHALVVSAHSGQPYNQLALVAWRRGRRLAALYWHVRSLLVRAPFPPAPANLARTLHAAASGGLSSLPVLPGLAAAGAAGAARAGRLDAHAYVGELIRAIHMIHTVEQLDTAAAIVDSLNSSLSTLIATDSFESMTLIKMTCVLIWLVHSTTEDLRLDGGALSADEAAAARLAGALAAAALLALLLPACTQEPPDRPLPAMKVWLQWLRGHGAFVRSGAWAARPALRAALAHALSRLAVTIGPVTDADTFETVPLPEDEELQGFLPLEEALRPLRFERAAWDTYGGRVPDAPGRASAEPLHQEGRALPALLDEALERRVRAHRLVQLGRQLCESHPDQLSCTEEDGVVVFTAVGIEPGAEGEALAGELEALRASAEAPASPGRAPPPVVISEADFREKVREKRVGILKPQGSLERAREERALASTQEDPDTDGGDDSSKSEDKKEVRKPRVNIAMAAIMRKQEEINKQVKFVTPPPTPETSEAATTDQEPKAIQPKPSKAIGALPLGRKTGGILALKDKSGYPHLVNADPEPKKDEKKEKQPPQHSQGFQPKVGAASPTWAAGPEGARAGIRLPVVNPKEIDVRSAALQKQNSRQDLFQEGHKFGNYNNYQMSGDKKNFLNDLPPRFANQYRYWQGSEPAEVPRQEAPQSLFAAPWAAPAWWDREPGYRAGGAPPEGYYAPGAAPGPPAPYAPAGLRLPDPARPPPQYMHSTIGQPQLQNMQNFPSPNFNPPLNKFGSYAPAPGYDAGMYPQFGKYPALGDAGALGFPTNGEPRGFGMKFDLNGDAMNMHNNQSGMQGGAGAGGSTYSLFSGAPDAAWADAHHAHQSLWSGPGPSPLERLLEQQKQMKPQ